MARMNKILVIAAMVAATTALAAHMPRPVVFDTPARDELGAMVLGNGELCALAWITPDGALHTVLQHSDSWNEGGRHVKTGAIDYATGKPVDAGTFRQELSLERGEFEASWKSGGTPVSMRYRVQHGTDSFAVCDVRGAPAAEAKVFNWRLYPGGEKSFTGGWDQLGNQIVGIKKGGPVDLVGPDGKRVEFAVSADRLVPGGWCHVNRNDTVAKMMKLYDYYQATADLGKPDLLSNRVFGGLTRELREGGRTLFLSAVTCLHPCRDEAEWLRRTNETLDREGWTVDGEEAKRAEHVAAWRAFWSRSHVELAPASGAAVRPRMDFVVNEGLPIGFGVNSQGGDRFDGTFGAVELSFGERKAYSGTPKPGDRIAPPRKEDAKNGMRFSCTFNARNVKGAHRLYDNVTPGRANGSLVDIVGEQLRVLVGAKCAVHPKKVPAGREVSLSVAVSPFGDVEIVLDGKVHRASLGGADVADECRAITTAYAAQRYVNLCTGRGRLPVRFNGSLLTLKRNGDWDYRNWGSGYWWQNTRLPYYTAFAAGDLEMLRPLFKLYGGLTEFNVKRTRKYLGHGGAYFTECMMPWGDQFTYVYGTSRAWKDRPDKLQDLGWHKYEWVGQLELSFLMLRLHAYTGDDAWFKAKALPVIREYVRFFDEHYKTGADGRYVMYPSQAAETWWLCTNAMPELAGLHAVTRLLLDLPESLVAGEDRALFSKIRARLPDLPVRTLADGRTAYAPAKTFTKKCNIETPELYCVFPFRVCSFEKPNAELGRNAYDGRWHKLYFGWAQDEVNAAYLGMTEEARVHVADRALKHPSKKHRWPVYWGPNFNELPDQDEGGIFMNAVQSMLMQYDGRKIFLLPAWPKEWNCSFKLHAPFKTTVEGRVVDGELKDLVVTPASRRADVVLP